MKDIVNLQTIPKDSLIKITVSTDLYIRIQQLLLEGLPYKSIEHFINCLKEARTSDTKDPLAFHLQTLLHLCVIIEDSAKQQGLIATQQYDLESKSVVS